jgi:hypothetical protein
MNRSGFLRGALGPVEHPLVSMLFERPPSPPSRRRLCVRGRRRPALPLREVNNVPLADPPRPMTEGGQHVNRRCGETHLAACPVP